MGKYEPLANYLCSLPDDRWDASFEQIERILGSELPPSARNHASWWGNSRRGNHSQAQGWVSVGWETREIDPHRGHVSFERTRSAGRKARTVADHELWRKAHEISGIADRKELEIAALTCFIQREAGRQLAEMGGTMPDLEVPPRRRIDW